MRVIGGKAKGKSLLSVPGDSTRPILDRVKVPLFDMLRPEINDLRVLDLFAGSGAVGIEALSQGAGHCVFIDLEKKAIETIKANLDNCGLSSQADVREHDAFMYLKKAKSAFGLIYVAPPQYQNLWVLAVHAIGERPELVESGGQIIAQIDPKEYEPLSLTEFVETDQRKYGNTLLVFFRKTS